DLRTCGPQPGNYLLHARNHQFFQAAVVIIDHVSHSEFPGLFPVAEITVNLEVMHVHDQQGRLPHVQFEIGQAPDNALKISEAQIETHACGSYCVVYTHVLMAQEESLSAPCRAVNTASSILTPP